MKGRVQMSLLTNTYDVHKGEFETAGDASASIKRKLKQLGVDSAVRDLGFGAGMGLPNMRRNADGFAIESQLGVGTTIQMEFRLK